MAAKVPRINLNNGVSIPALGLGTWKSNPGEVTQAVKDAITIGYRHIDCAHVYHNEKEVGAGINAKISEGATLRKDIFITSKLWNSYHRPDMVERALKTTLSNLGLEYLDLYLIHWPFAFKEGDDLFPADKSGKTILSDVDYVDTWKAMEGVCKKGLTKMIGISNFNKKQIERVLEKAAIKPVINQVECHPYLTQTKLSEFCKSKGIAITAYSPLGSGDSPLLEDAKIKSIADKYKKTPAQVVLKYQVQRGHITIPKSVHVARIQENFDIWDLELTVEDIEAINSLNRNGRVCAFGEYSHVKYYPFADEY